MAGWSLVRLVEKGAGLLQKGGQERGGADIHIHGASDTMTNLPKTKRVTVNGDESKENITYDLQKFSQDQHHVISVTALQYYTPWGRVCRSVGLHEVFNVEVIQSVPRWRRLPGTLGCSRRHLQRHFTPGQSGLPVYTEILFLSTVRAIPVPPRIAPERKPGLTMGIMGAPGAPGFTGTEEQREVKLHFWPCVCLCLSESVAWLC